MKRSSALEGQFMPGRWLVALALMGTTCGFAQAECNANMPLTRPDSRYELVAGANPEGSEVRDKVTGLIWKRCVLGMTWTGSTCVGIGNTVTWQQALDIARTAEPSAIAGAGRWRLPNHKELYSLAERSCYNPAINATWFPATLTRYTWSSSPASFLNEAMWRVSFYTGLSDYDGKDYDAAVRFVRSAQ